MSLSLRHRNRIKLFKFSERHSNFCLKIFNHLATACQTMSSLLRAKVSLRMIVFINSNDMSSNSSLSRTWFYSTIKCCFLYTNFHLFCISIKDSEAVLDHLFTGSPRQLGLVHLRKIFCKKGEQLAVGQ